MARLVKFLATLITLGMVVAHRVQSASAECNPHGAIRRSEQQNKKRKGFSLPNTAYKGGPSMRFPSVTNLLRVFGVVLLLGAPALYADPLQVRLISGGTTITVIDTAHPQGVGYIELTGPITVGLWTVDHLIAAFGIFPLELHSYSLTSAAGAGTLQILVTRDATFPPTPQFLFRGGGGAQPAGASVTFTLFGGNSSTPFDTSNTVTTSGSLTGTSFGFNRVGSGNTVYPYSLTVSAEITAPTTGTGTFKYSANPAGQAQPFPEPVSVLTLGLALAGLCLCKHRLKG
jgi:hypothetical protein